ncbi:MAG: Rrf2 family transcriptional regulator [Agriterribacter sp.]
MFSKTCEYAIRAMILIAQQSKKGAKSGIKEIVQAIDCPEYFIAKILQELARQGLVQSTKGPNGGFYLNDDSFKCSMADVVRAIDGDKIFSGCGLGLKQCSENRPCPIHHEFKKIRNEIHIMLSNARLDEFTDVLEKKMVFLKRK